MPVKHTSEIFAFASNRLDRKLFPQQTRPHYFRLSRGVYVGYRTSKAGAGTWNKRINGELKRLGLADDYEKANGVEVLTFEQACEATRGEVRSEASAGNACTLGKALTVEYAGLLRDNGKGYLNAVTVYNHIKRVAPAMLKRDVHTATRKEWRDLRAALLDGGVSRMNWNRISKNLRAALNHVHAANKAVWGEELKKVADLRTEDEIANNVVLDEAEVLRWIAAAYEESPAFGLLIDVLATTGTRPCQAVRLRVKHLRAGDNRLDMPRSGKGSRDPAERRRTDYKCYIPPSLTQRLAAAAKGRGPMDTLLLCDKGESWNGKGNRPFRKYGPLVAATLKRIGLETKDGKQVTVYALRHTDITRQLKGKKNAEGKYIMHPLPTLMVAKAHDTSVIMIEKHYAAHINDHAEDMIRATLLDHGTVVTLKGKVA